MLMIIGPSPLGTRPITQSRRTEVSQKLGAPFSLVPSPKTGRHDPILLRSRVKFAGHPLTAHRTAFTVITGYPVDADDSLSRSHISTSRSLAESSTSKTKSHAPPHESTVS
nr:hypothetical protein Iba_chr05cCG1920 [Ipomoea batatas]